MDQFFNQERAIDEVITLNQQRFRFVGEPGKEYDLIQSILVELNQTLIIDNRHLSRYAAIHYLVQSYFRGRSEWSLSGFGPHTSVNGLQYKTVDSTALESPYHSPSCIDELERFMIGVARLGVALARKQPVAPEYIQFRIAKISDSLKNILNTLRQNPASQIDEFLLALFQGLTHFHQILTPFSPPEAPLLQSIKSSKDFQDLIQGPATSIPPAALARHHCLDLFWSGIIP